MLSTSVSRQSIKETFFAMPVGRRTFIAALKITFLYGSSVGPEVQKRAASRRLASNAFSGFADRVAVNGRRPAFSESLCQAQRLVSIGMYL